MELLHGLLQAFESAEQIPLRGGNVFVSRPILHLPEWMDFQPVCYDARPDLWESGEEGMFFFKLVGKNLQGIVQTQWASRREEQLRGIKAFFFEEFGTDFELVTIDFKDLEGFQIQRSGIALLRGKNPNIPRF